MLKRSFFMGALLALCCLAVLAQDGLDTKFTNKENYPDGTTVYQGDKIKKRWQVEVVSGTAHNVYVIQTEKNHWGLGKSGLIGPKKATLLATTKKPIQAGQTFWVEAVIQVPKSLPPDTYELDVRMCNKKGVPFNTKKKPLYALLEVKAR